MLEDKALHNLNFYSFFFFLEEDCLTLDIYG